MPRTVDYPRASLGRCLELAAAVHELGGECSLAVAAERLGARPGGAFHAVVSAAGRYGLVSVRKGRLRAEPAFRTYRLAYDDAERERTLASALAAVPLFRQLLDRFGGKTFPEGRLDRVLVREYAVPEHSAERVARYFLDGARAAGLLSGGQLRAARIDVPMGDESSTRTGRAARTSEPSTRLAESANVDAERDTFRVHVTGPGLDSRVELTNATDLELVRALFGRLERALRDRQ